MADLNHRYYQLLALEENIYQKASSFPAYCDDYEADVGDLALYGGEYHKVIGVSNAVPAEAIEILIDLYALSPVSEIYKMSYSSRKGEEEDNDNA